MNIKNKRVFTWYYPQQVVMRYFRKSRWKVSVLLPKEIHLDEEFHWEMALVELFWPKQDSLSVRENLWYEIQESKRKWKRTHIPTSLFHSVSSLLDYVRQELRKHLTLHMMNMSKRSFGN